MLIQTDVKCLYCGHTSWRVELEARQSWRTAEVIWPELGGRLPQRPLCTRCGGPVYLDGDYRRVSVRQRELTAMRERARADERQAASPLGHYAHQIEALASDRAAA